ncbi:hypothetical protein B0H19DRAFT_1059689 [Mycena capillaripes]|nr:hypothetical protein B0H19DRAFT_1059689 [Mycena capillaripes]
MPADIQLLSSVLLGSLSLIPNNLLRYIALGSAVTFALVYNLYLSRTTWLHHLEQAIRQTEQIFELARTECTYPQEKFKLAQEWVRFLEGPESNDPRLKCNAAFWNRGDSPGNNIGTSRDVSLNAPLVSTIFVLQLSICQLILEAKRQRKLDEDITETHSVLANAQTTCTGLKSSTFPVSTGWKPSTCLYLRVNLTYLLPNLEISSSENLYLLKKLAGCNGCYQNCQIWILALFESPGDHTQQSVDPKHRHGYREGIPHALPLERSRHSPQNQKEGTYAWPSKKGSFCSTIPVRQSQVDGRVPSIPFVAAVSTGNRDYSL